MDNLGLPRGIVVFGGGTATNSLVDVFENLRETRRCALQYIIPISDNGGSSSELIRVFGGPGIGDVRSRLVRLIPASETDAERAPLKALFNHRLSSDPQAARSEWLDIVEGRHAGLWTDVSSEKRELIRSIFNHMNMEIVKRARPSSVFNFSRASIGNLFLTGARLFTGSLESAIYLLSTICAVPSTVATLPAINSNFTHHISAGLEDGSQITGQNAISHPSAPTSLPDTNDSNSAAVESICATPSEPATSTSTPVLFLPSPTLTTKNLVPPRPRSVIPEDPQTVRRETEAHDRIEDATLPGSLPSLRKPYLTFNKSTTTGTSAGGSGGGHNGNNDDEDNDELPSRISRIWYINPYGHEIYPVANPKAISAITRSTAVIYSIGSLYTSLVPSLILRGMGEAITSPLPFSGNMGVMRQRKKILILNSTLDRETGPTEYAFTATDFVRAVARACAQSETMTTTTTTVTSTAMEGKDMPNGMTKVDDSESESDSLLIKKYVTHLLYLEGEGAPKVDRAELARLGVECVRVYGRRVDGMLRYDEARLEGALEAIVGKVEIVRSRRNTSGK